MCKLDDIETYSSAAIHDNSIARSHLGAILDGVVRCCHRVGDDGAFDKRYLSRQDEDIFRWSFDIFGIGSIYVIAEHTHVLADILPAIAASGTSTTRENRRQEHPIPFADAGNCWTSQRNSACGFMSENKRRWLDGWYLVIDIVQVGMAQATR